MTPTATTAAPNPNPKPMTPEQFAPNRWKLTEGADGSDVIDYFTTEDAAYDQYAKFDLDKRAVRLYSCMEDGDGGLSEWEIEEWNCDLDTGAVDSGNPNRA